MPTTNPDGIALAQMPSVILAQVLAGISPAAKKYFAQKQQVTTSPEAAPAPWKVSGLPLAYAYISWPDEEDQFIIRVKDAENRHPEGYFLDGLTFHRSACRPMVEQNIHAPYIVLNADVQPGLKDLLNFGMKLDGRQWDCCFSLVKDGAATLILVDADFGCTTDFTQFAAQELGVSIEMSEFLQAFPVSKYAKRYLAPQQILRKLKAIKLDWLNKGEYPARVHMNYTDRRGALHVFRVVFLKNTPLIDGASWMTERMADVLFHIKAVAVRPDDAQLLRLRNGHTLVLPNDYPHWAGQADMVVADIKGQLKSLMSDEDGTSETIISVLADKHGEKFAKTDLQSVCDFNLWRFLLGWVKNDLTTWMQFLKAGSLTQVDDDRHFGAVVNRANELGLTDFRPLRIPALLRRLFGAMTSRFNRMSKRSRKLEIVIPDSARAYMMVHPHVVGKDFSVDEDNCPEDFRGDCAHLKTGTKGTSQLIGSRMLAGSSPSAASW